MSYLQRVGQHIMNIRIGFCCIVAGKKYAWNCKEFSSNFVPKVVTGSRAAMDGSDYNLPLTYKDEMTLLSVHEIVQGAIRKIIHCQ